MLKPVEELLTDGENNAIETDIVYRIRGDGFASTMEEIARQHGPDIGLLPVSAGSAGGGVFQRKNHGQNTIIGVQIAAATDCKISLSECHDLTALALDQIIVDRNSSRIYAGAAVTLEQLNQALQTTLSERYKVLGADLTSYTYAQVGATFMTGGMGPQRRYFSDSVDSIALYDGDQIKLVKGDALDGYAGSYGWTGIVTAVCCRYYQLPENEIAFAMPVSNSPVALARLLAHLSDCVYLQVMDDAVFTDRGSDDLVLGIEHITADAMGPMLASGSDSAIHQRARQLQQKCVAANADGLVFINGRSNRQTDDFLFGLVDAPDADNLTIAGIALEHTEVFNVADEMRAVREAVPAAARGQAPRGRYAFKGHTDANIRLDRQKTGEAMETLWHANQQYVEAVNACFAQEERVNGEILVYGHLNPYGIDPHNRITFASDSAAVCENMKSQIEQQTHQFFRQLDQLCRETDSIFVGGEKGAGSEFEIIAAFDPSHPVPASIQRKFDRQCKQIGLAGQQFSWRALSLYRPD